MRTIARNENPPQCLGRHPKNQDWQSFMQTECHRTVGKSLRAEQQHLCCYCETAKMKAENGMMIDFAKVAGATAAESFGD